MRHLAFLPALVLMLGAGPVFAEYYGLMNGRSADVANAPDSSIEAGAVFGDLFEADYQHLGLRYNYKSSPELMLFGNFGQTEVEDFDGLAFGIGAFYQLGGVLTNSDLAIKGSYNRVKLESGNVDGNASSFAVEALISGRDGLGASGNIGWYANIGIHKLDFDDLGDDETELGFGGGIIIPSTSGEIFAGIDLIDEMTFGAGFRYFLQ